MNKWNLVIDVAKCFNCQMCALSCADEYCGNDFPGYAAAKPQRGHRWIDVIQREQGTQPMVEVTYLPVTCNHCDDAPCVRAAKNGAVKKRDDGIVLIVPELAQGQKELVASCPYRMIWWNEEKQLPQAWPFDAHLLDSGWTKTRGSQVCATGAWRTLHVDDAEMQRIVKEENLQVLHPEYKTRPRVWYKNLDRWYTVFVGGTLAGPTGGVTECLEGAQVMLEKDGRLVAEAKSDAYGDFRFTGLAESSGAYRLKVSDPRFRARSIDFELQQSAYLGSIDLQPAGS